MATWIVACKFATPPMLHELKEGRKTIALVRRVTGKWRKRNGKPVYQHHYQVVRQWVGAMGHATGPVFSSLIAAKRAAEKGI